MAKAGVHLGARQTGGIGRRSLLGLLGGAAATAIWPLPSNADQADRLRRIGVLSGFAHHDPEAHLRASSFEKGLRDLGWIKGRNLQIDYRSAGDGSVLQSYASQLVSLAPELILANSTPVAAALQKQTRTVPILFVQVTDPIGQGFVKTLAQPGGNLTGIINFEFSIGSKWLQVLKEAAPHVTRVGLVFNPDTAPFADLFIRPIEAIAPSFAITPTTASGRDAAELERAIKAFAAKPHGALVVLPDVSAANHRVQIIALAARHRLPTIYPYRLFAASGGLMSYGSDVADIYRRIASYVDRILRGEKPADLPVRAPVNYELVINLRSAKAIHLEVPPGLLTLADEGIE
jgi:putative ABC transport system substrate-binding protein